MEFIEEDEEITFDPEDCEYCGCPSYEFGDEDFINGTWRCPQCGMSE